MARPPLVNGSLKAKCAHAKNLAAINDVLHLSTSLSKHLADLLAAYDANNHAAKYPPRDRVGRSVWKDRHTRGFFEREEKRLREAILASTEALPNGASR